MAKRKKIRERLRESKSAQFIARRAAGAGRAAARVGRSARGNAKDLFSKQGAKSLLQEVAGEVGAAATAVGLDLLGHARKWSAGNVVLAGGLVKVGGKILGMNRFGSQVNVGVMARRGLDAVADLLPATAGVAIKAISGGK